MERKIQRSQVGLPSILKVIHYIFFFCGITKSIIVRRMTSKMGHHDGQIINSIMKRAETSLTQHFTLRFPKDKNIKSFSKKCELIWNSGLQLQLEDLSLNLFYTAMVVKSMYHGHLNQG